MNIMIEKEYVNVNGIITQLDNVLQGEYNNVNEYLEDINT